MGFLHQRAARYGGWESQNVRYLDPAHFMTGIRPVMIAVAWLMAAMILIGFKRGE